MRKSQKRGRSRRIDAECCLRKYQEIRRVNGIARKANETSLTQTEIHSRFLPHLLGFEKWRFDTLLGFVFESRVLHFVPTSFVS